jgi:hypothetical protein
MDKEYKPLVVREVKRLMALRQPKFTLTQVPSRHPLRDIFSGAMLFAWPARQDRTVWLWWVLGPGVERCIDVLVGWSPRIDTLPHPGKHEPRLYSLRGPDPGFPAAAIHLQQIQGESAIGGFTIPSPWDQVSSMKPMSPKREHVAAIEKAHSEAASLSSEHRVAAVLTTLEPVFEALNQVLPAFTSSPMGVPE